MKSIEYLTVVREIFPETDVRKLIGDEYIHSFGWLDALLYLTQMRNNFPDLTEVIEWLESGKSVIEAIKELKTIQHNKIDKLTSEVFYVVLV